MSDFDQIKKEIEWIYANKGTSKNIDLVNKYIIHDNRIGNSIEHIKRRNYANIFDKNFSDDKYFIVFTDFSILHFDYLFDNESEVIFSRLSFLPYVENADVENTQLSKYIRIDYEPKDYKEIIHTKCHLHVGIDKNNFRIPVSTVLFPKEFVYFILKYIYHEDSKFIDLITPNNEKEVVLSESEMKKLRLSIG